MFQLAYNIDIELFAFFLTILLYVEIRLHYPKGNNANRAFRTITLLVIFTELFDMASAFMNTERYGVLVPRGLNIFINSGYFILGFVLIYLLHYYIQITFVPEKGKTCFLHVNKWVLLLTELSYLPNAWFGFYFFISPTGQYIHGPLYLLQHLISFWLILCASLTLILNYKVVKRERILSGFLFIILYFGALFLQLFVFPNIFLVMPAVSIMLVIAMFALESPDYVQLQNTLQELSRTKMELEEANGKLGALAYTDRMTGLKNRTAYSTQVDSIRSSPSLEGIIFLMVDINGLKDLNDHYGHLTGDDAIVRTAKLLKNAFGDVCQCCRIGGDEFAVISDRLSQDEFSERCRRFEASVRQEQENVTYPFSVAVGYQAVGQDTLLDAQRKADENMYADKLSKKSTPKEP